MATCARALIFDTKGNVLLGLEARTQEYGLAGGHCEEGEHPVDALLREVHEETGLGPHFPHFEYLRDYLDNSIFLVIVNPPPAIPSPSGDPDCEFTSFIWGDPAHLPDNVSEFASDVIFHYLCGLVGKATAGAEWSDYVKGEWWITDHGSEFADIDVGDSGHEQLALQALLASSFDEFKEALDPDDQDDRLKETDDLIAYYWNEGKIPDAMGQEIMGADLWKDMKDDVRTAYSKHKGAIRAIDFNFSAWKVTAKVISLIQDHIYNQVDADLEKLEGSPDVVIEEDSTGKSASLPVMDFLNIKNPGELWRAKASIAGVIEVMVDGEKVGELADDQVWETLPRMAQERARGKKVSFRQILDNGEVVDMTLGVGLPGLSEAAIDSLESAIQEFRDHQADYVGFIKMTDSVAQDLRGELEGADQIPIYRCVSVEDKDKFLKSLQAQGTGLYWTHNPERAVCYWGDDEHPYRAILTGIAGDAIDWMGTVVQHMRPSTAGEDEVRLLDHKQVQVTEVEFQDSRTKESTVIPVGRKLPTGSFEEERPPSRLSASLSTEGAILQLVHYFFDNYFHVDCPPLTITTLTTSEPWLAKTEHSKQGITLTVNNAIIDVPKVLRQAVAHEAIHVFLYSQNKLDDPHGQEFDEWASVINADEGEDYINKTAEQTAF